MADLKNTNIDNNLELPSGTTGERPSSPQEGQIRYNTDLETAEFWNGSNWRPLSDTHPEATGGTVVDTDIGGVPYRIHYFTETGTDTLTVTNPGEVEYLIVAGGGAGGGDSRGGGGAGGGGAGGVLTGNISVDSSSYTIVVGSGGTGVEEFTGNNGEDSSAFGLTAIGGGGGGGDNSPRTGNDGGSGGGEYRDLGGDSGSGTPGQGNDGGRGSFADSGYTQRGGGGGGAAQPGISNQSSSDGDDLTPPDGGQGVAVSISGSVAFYAGGGGGGAGKNSTLSRSAAGGLGGGADAPPIETGRQDGLDAQPNTGGGGSGAGGNDAGNNSTGGDGGSGIVIIRYPRNSSLDTEPDRTVIVTQPNNFQTVRDGLVLELDAGNPVSYPGSGDTWRDLSGNENNGTLENGVGYTSQNYGSLTFDGVDDRIEVSGYTGVLGADPRTSIIWLKLDAQDDNRFLSWGSNSTGEKYHIRSDDDGTLRVENSGGQKYGSSNEQIITDGLWHQCVVVLPPDSSDVQDHLLYVDGKQYTDTEGNPQSINIADSAPVTIGNPGNSSTDEFTTGFIAIVQIYNRALSEAEITQNFNALRGRYGI